MQLPQHIPFDTALQVAKLLRQASDLLLAGVKQEPAAPVAMRKVSQAERIQNLAVELVSEELPGIIPYLKFKRK